MSKLIILDYVVSTVHIYDVEKNVEINEEYIENLGYNTECCSWMVSDDMEIIKHKGILK